MTWLLIIIGIGGQVSVVEFNDELSCKVAATSVSVIATGMAVERVGYGAVPPVKVTCVSKP